jgi:tetratricopeptide (TPR) repeat protein
MVDEQEDRTSPAAPNEDTRPISTQGEPKTDTRSIPWWLWVIGGVLVLLIIAGLGAFSGYRSGIQDRIDFQNTQEVQNCQEQFDLGVDDLASKRYEVARQRFEYVIQLCPDYPNVTEMLADTLLAQNTTATPTAVPTPTLTPTPDLRGAEELFEQARNLLAVEDWSAALDTLDALRKKQPDYNPIEVDGMYYVALRNRGVEKIRDGNLEGGTYDLAQAERFGPLDTEADAWRTWANLYVTGASFWEINWPQAINYFSELSVVAPNLRDLSGWTATERLRQAHIGYGDQLARAGDFCNAQAQYEQALALAENPDLEPTATQAAEQCWTPTPEPRPPSETPQVETPAVPPATEEPPSPEPSAESPTQPPSATPAPTDTPGQAPLETPTPGS